jgi:predicted membrane chloride channel (bestrophin family)
VVTPCLSGDEVPCSYGTSLFFDLTHLTLFNKSVVSKKMSVTNPIVTATTRAARTLPFVPKTAHEYTWEELCKIEKERRSILPRGEDGFWEILGRWDGTCVKFLAFDPLLWFTMALYVGIRMQARFGNVPTYVADLVGSTNIALLGGFLSFFLVLFVNKNHARYFGLYENCMACKGRILDVATLARAYLPKTTATRLVRYMNAAHVSAYVGLSKVYPSKTFFERINKDLGLLTDTEFARMKEVDLDAGGSANRELVVWCMQEVKKCHNAGLIDHELAQQFRDQVLQLRANTGKLYDAADLPVPFFYVHFICLLSVFFLPLFAVSVSFKAGTGEDVFWTADVVAGLVVLLQSMFVIGLRILGTKMSDPFGDDAIDLSVMFYCTFNWRMSNRILEAPEPDIRDGDEVQLMKARTEKLGKAWEETAVIPDNVGTPNDVEIFL